jgi:hypothetical protein
VASAAGDIATPGEALGEGDGFCCGIISAGLASELVILAAVIDLELSGAAKM